ncbi:hypothetical protein [Candidatus Methylocalor cossyra]|uniref:Uncharacterized protein n=1 Tax=Candidatus Methylocalor cossyra TaxID=3108543 RepID=A0ABP1CB06_9GAMM
MTVYHHQKLVTRAMLDCFRRDIHSGHPVFANHAIKVLKECVEGKKDFDCEATRLNAINLYGAVTSQR